jgi:hypothetical protein|tara:strand:+ start:4652 stop:4825 length:174 start_codon:yes stop_codon:yes gene_type:complete
MKLRLGDRLEWLFRVTGVKWLVNLIVIDLLGYESCGCKERQVKLNEIEIDWEERWKK